MDISLSFIPFKKLQDIAWKKLKELCPEGIVAPINIEDIIEKKLGITIDYKKMNEKFLGQSYIPNNEIIINKSLLSNVRRMRYTMAHELGHFMLHHRLYDLLSPKELLSFYNENHYRIEKQANIFAANFLMPPPLVFNEWVRLTCSADPYSIEEENRKDQEFSQEQQRKQERGETGNSERGCTISFFPLKSCELKSEISDIFDVSYDCARIQLEYLGFFTAPNINRGRKFSSEEIRQNCSIFLS